MLSDLFKKALPSDQMAEAIYIAIVQPLLQSHHQDPSGHNIFSREEQMLLVVAHLSKLLEAKKLTKVQVNLVVICAKDFYGVKDDKEFTNKLIDITIRIKEINEFFNNATPLTRFASEPFLFGKRFDLASLMPAVQACIDNQKTVDEVLSAMLTRFKVKDA